MPHESDRQNAGPDSADRRTTTRSAPVASYRGIEAETRQPITLVNISEGGMLVHTPRAATLGDTRVFDFEVGNHSASLTLAAKVVHVVPVTAANGVTYALGLKFLDSLEREQRRAIVALLKSD